MIERIYRLLTTLPAGFALIATGCGSSDANGDIGNTATSTPDRDAALDEAGSRGDGATNDPRDGGVRVDTNGRGDAYPAGDTSHPNDALTTGDAHANDVTSGDRVFGDAVDRGAIDAPSDLTTTVDAMSDVRRDDPGNAGCADLPLCDDFELATAGSPPPAPTWSIVTPNCSGTSTVVVDDTQAHSGKRSVKVGGAGGYCNHVFFSATSPVAATGAHLFGRMYVRFATPLGEAHVTFMAMRDSIENKDLRMGGQKSILMWNRESDDATLPELSPTGIALSVAPAPNAWTCVEFEIDGAAGTIGTWVGGTQIAGLVEDGSPTPDVDSAWLRKSWQPSLTDVKFGWESYGDQTMTLWFDDIAVGPRRIGCSAE